MSWAEWCGATFPAEQDVRGDIQRTTFVGSWAEWCGAVFPHPDIVRAVVLGNAVTDDLGNPVTDDLSNRVIDG